MIYYASNYYEDDAWGDAEEGNYRTQKVERSVSMVKMESVSMTMAADEMEEVSTEEVAYNWDDLADSTTFKEDKKVEVQEVKVRTNFNEMAYFFPNLSTNEKVIFLCLGNKFANKNLPAVVVCFSTLSFPFSSTV